MIECSMKKARLVAAFALASTACARESAQPSPRPLPAASGAPAASPNAAAPRLPIAVFVLAEAKDASPSALAQEWVKELEAVLAANSAQFKLVKSEAHAEVVVRIASVMPSPQSPGKAVMSGSIARGGSSTGFRLDYTGGASAMAGRFANYVAAQVDKARQASPKPAQ